MIWRKLTKMLRFGIEVKDDGDIIYMGEGYNWGHDTDIDDFIMYRKNLKESLWERTYWEPKG